MLAAKPVIEAHQNAVRGLLGSDDIARDRIGDLAYVAEGEIVRDNTAPSIGAEFDGRHDEAVYAKPRRWKSEETRSEKLQQLTDAMRFEPFHDFGDVLGAIASANEKRIRGIDDDEVGDSYGANEFSRTPE